MDVFIVGLAVAIVGYFVYLLFLMRPCRKGSNHTLVTYGMIRPVFA